VPFAFTSLEHPERLRDATARSVAVTVLSGLISRRHPSESSPRPAGSRSTPGGERSVRISVASDAGASHTTSTENGVPATLLQPMLRTSSSPRSKAHGFAISTARRPGPGNTSGSGRHHSERPWTSSFIPSSPAQNVAGIHAKRCPLTLASIFTSARVVTRCFSRSPATAVYFALLAT